MHNVHGKAAHLKLSLDVLASKHSSLDYRREPILPSKFGIVISIVEETQETSSGSCQSFLQYTRWGWFEYMDKRKRKGTLGEISFDKMSSAFFCKNNFKNNKR
jgi:hypothetical protein